VADANILPIASSEGTNTARPTLGPAGLLPDFSTASAYLSLDLIVAKSNQAFMDATSVGGSNAAGRNLLELVSTTDRDNLYAIKRIIEEERQRRDPAYIRPMRASEELDAIQRMDYDESGRDSRGSQEHEIELSFRLPDGYHAVFTTRMKLARSSVYFVILSFPVRNRPDVSQYAPPTSPYAPLRQRPMPSPGYGQRGQGSYTQMPQGRPFSSGSSTSASPYYSYQTSTHSVSSPGDEFPPTRNIHAPQAFPRPPPTSYMPGPAYTTSAPQSYTEGISPSRPMLNQLLRGPGPQLSPSANSEQDPFALSRPRLGRVPTELQLPPLRSASIPRSQDPGSNESVIRRTSADERSGAVEDDHRRGRKRERMDVEEMLQ
jgi:hypothetical protein